jgi:hypothetical protein
MGPLFGRRRPGDEFAEGPYSQTAFGIARRAGEQREAAVIDQAAKGIWGRLVETAVDDNSLQQHGL